MLGRVKFKSPAQSAAAAPVTKSGAAHREQQHWGSSIPMGAASCTAGTQSLHQTPTHGRSAPGGGAGCIQGAGRSAGAAAWRLAGDADVLLPDPEEWRLFLFLQVRESSTAGISGCHGARNPSCAALEMEKEESRAELCPLMP